MDGLRSTVAKLAALRGHIDGLMAATREATSRAAPDGLRLKETVEFGRNPGKLRMWQHVPEGLTSKPALVVALHGCTQTASSYDDGSGWSTLAERYGFALLMPEQQAANNPNMCFNWFVPGHTRRGGGEAMSIHQMIRCMIANHGVDASRVFIVGLSAGGAMSAAMLAAYPETFAAGAVIAGLPAGAAADIREAMDAMRQGRQRPAAEWGDHVRRASPNEGPWPRISVWHGDSDPIVHPENAENLIQQWSNVHALMPEPDAVETQAGHHRRVWRDSIGTVLIESTTIVGMSHGVPLGFDNEEDRCGRAGPYHFDVGISSAASILRFFGIADAVARRTTDEPVGQPKVAPAATASPGRRATASAFPLDTGSTDPSEAIARALRQAGLLDENTSLDPRQIIAKTLRSVGVLKKK